jgi:hypothetical protein
MMHTGAIHFCGHSLIWKTWVPMKVKIFLWLAFKRRHWTNDRRARHGLVPREELYLCDQAPETIDHLLTCCLYSREVGSSCVVPWDACCRQPQRPCGHGGCECGPDNKPARGRALTHSSRWCPGSCGRNATPAVLGNPHLRFPSYCRSSRLWRSCGCRPGRNT